MEENNNLAHNFQTSKEQLTQCQNQNSLTSCLQCPKVLECPIRDEYVKNTYAYLSKGEDGEFEF